MGFKMSNYSSIHIFKLKMEDLEAKDEETKNLLLQMREVMVEQQNHIRALQEEGMVIAFVPQAVALAAPIRSARNPGAALSVSLAGY